MSKMSNYLENALLNAVLRNTAYTSPTTVYLALYTSDPSDSDLGSEVSVSGTGYARQEISLTAPSDGVTSNSADILFPIALSSWGVVTHIGIRDALTNGNLLFYGAISIAKTVSTADQFTIKTGNLTISLD